MLKLEEKTLDFDGRRYTLRCNMSVLESLEAKHGDFDTIMQLPQRQLAFELLEIMLQDSAEENGAECPKGQDLKKRMSYAMLMELDLIGMLVRSISPEAASAAEAPGN